MTFTKGDRVRLSEAGRKIPAWAKHLARLGTVVGTGKLTGVVHVLWDGLRYPQGWHAAWLERAPE
jgi:hypothetical protein